MLEVLVAGVVLTKGVILVLQGITGALGASGRIQRRCEAAALAAEMLNRFAAGQADLPLSGEEARDGVPVERLGVPAQPL